MFLFKLLFFMQTICWGGGLGGVLADIYLHNPRGSNNRCDERTNDRANANRLFDSQNNGAGGYAVPCQDTDLNCFNMNYYTGSYLDIRFTTQHACGVQNQCEIIMQYSCNMRNGNPASALGNTCTQTMPDINNTANLQNPLYGYHETYEYYQSCKTRPRNLNLYTGDQRLGGLSAIYTRQNPNGQRYGFECPEERDYYPYWGSTPWRDIGIMTSNRSRCDYYNNSAIVCIDVNHTAVNRLGATYEGRSESSFRWKIPEETGENCVFRIRYNISLSSDLDWFADNKSNGLYKTDPLINVDGHYVRLALDTAQLPRTFEDRSYTFNIIQRPADITIYNINVQGKRGNIAQVRNCIEYDFVPNNITINDTDYLHFQWVGSDFNPLGNDGEGRAGTDRSNIIEIMDYLGYNRAENNTFVPADLIESFVYLFQLPANCFTFAELIGQNKIVNTQDGKNCALLNNASVYFNSRVFRITLKGNETNKTHYYMSTRNNNFSNRNQKGAITVLRDMSVTTTTTTTTTITTTSPIFENINVTDNVTKVIVQGTSPLIVLVLLLAFAFLICVSVYCYRNYTTIKKKSEELTNRLTRSMASEV